MKKSDRELGMGQSNHYHVVIRIDADAVKQWTDQEVASRWMQIFTRPLLMHQYLGNADLTEFGLENLADLFATWRNRLCDLSWSLPVDSSRIKANSTYDQAGYKVRVPRKIP